jgi:hypothetical protein
MEHFMSLPVKHDWEIITAIDWDDWGHHRGPCELCGRHDPHGHRGTTWMGAVGFSLDTFAYRARGRTLPAH